MKLFVLLIFFFYGVSSIGQNLPRKADWKARTSFANPGITVTNVDAAGAAYKSGLRDGDLIITIDNQAIVNSIAYAKLVRSLRAGQTYEVVIKRVNEVKNLKLKLDEAYKESAAGLEIAYSSFLSDRGYRIRTVISKPVGVNEKLPAILFVQWLSCSSVEARGDNHGFSNAIWELSRQGFLVQRTEKPGVGDSEGPDCSELDFDTELAIHQEALEELMKHEDVDTSRIYVFGGSMGSNIGAIVAQDPSVKAYAFSGGYYKPWSERLLDFERRRLEYADTPPQGIYTKMQKFSVLYHHYFYDQMTPGEVVKKNPELLEVWSGSPAHQYGRPVEFYQRANAINMGAVWGFLKKPVIGLYGEYDWIMDESDHRHAVEAGKNPKSKLVILPKTDHSLYLHAEDDSKKEAFNNRSSTPNKDTGKLIADWIKSL